MKPRIPGTFTAAITKIQQELSDEQCAEIVGRSDSLVRKWSDPDHPSLPTLGQALALDLAFLNQGHREAPILDSYQENLADTMIEHDVDDADVLMSILSLHGSAGSLSDALRNAIGSSGRNFASFTASDTQTILEIIAELEKSACIIRSALMKHVRTDDRMTVANGNVVSYLRQ